MTTKELNAQLLDVCLADEVDYERAEALLRQGAEPLGIVDDPGSLPPWDNLYTVVISELFMHDVIPEALYKITELFLRYGMDISRPSVPYSEDSPSPLRTFSPPSGESGDCVLRTLQLLLDHGVSAEEARDCWMEALWTLELLDCDLTDPDERMWLDDFIRKLLLIASYPHILADDADLQREIWLDQNHGDLTLFRDWGAYTYEIDTTHCERYPDARGSLITIIEKSSGRKVWTFGFCLDPQDV